MCMLINAVSKAPVKENLPRPIPGYGIRWNIKLQCWSRLYNAREVSKNLCFCIPLSFIHPDLNNVLLFQVIDHILKDDQMEPSRRGHRAAETVLAPDIHRPRGIFNKVMISPDEWRRVRDLMEVLQVSLMSFNILIILLTLILMRLCRSLKI